MNVACWCRPVGGAVWHAAVPKALQPVPSGALSGLCDLGLPWKSSLGFSAEPMQLSAQALPALTGLVLPVLALPAAAYNEHGWLGATVLVPYLFTLAVQIWSETWYNKRGVRPPRVHHATRALFDYFLVSHGGPSMCFWIPRCALCLCVWS